MIPQQIVDYLERHAVAYERHPHGVLQRAGAAAAMHVSGRRVAKSVIVKGDDRIWIAVLPAVGSGRRGASSPASWECRRSATG